MGRGLSDVQRWILGRARLNGEAEGVEFGDCRHAEVMHGFYGWGLRTPIRLHSAPTQEWPARWIRENPGSKHFKPSVDRPRYLANKAAVAKAIRRLGERGLLERWTCRLTPAGLALAVAPDPAEFERARGAFAERAARMEAARAMLAALRS